jgi:transcriptional regulator with XRE-family HTH domain
MGRRRRAEEIAELLERYQSSGMTQAEYCQRAGVGRSTLDRYLRRQRKGQRLVRVSLEAKAEQEGGFVLVLGSKALTAAAPQMSSDVTLLQGSIDRSRLLSS